MSDTELPAESIRSATHRRGKVDVFDDLDPTRTALVVIDMQNAWLAPNAPFETAAARELIPGINRLAATLREHGGRVIWIQHTTGLPGSADYWALYFDNFIKPENRAAAAAALVPGNFMYELAAELDVLQGDIVLPKYRFSAFARNPIDLEARLRTLNIDSLIVTGTATNVCVESTVRDAMMRDFRVFMPRDAVAAPSRDGHLAALRNIMQSFADVRPLESVIALIRGHQSDKASHKEAHVI
jgi:ureidoacrylate peracid hydrolase